MSRLVIKTFAVGNADCIVITMPDNEALAVVDAYRHSSLSSYSISSQNGASRFIFACLTHPHEDHMRDINNVLETVAKSGGEFWHTIYGMDEVLELHTKPRVLSALKRSRISPINQLSCLAGIAKIVSELFPPEKIRFISTRPKGILELLREDGVTIDALSPLHKETTEYLNMLKRIDNEEITSFDSRIINKMSAILRIKYGGKIIMLGADAPDQIWLRLTGRTEDAGKLINEVDVVKASHHGSDDSYYPGIWDDLFGNKTGIVLVSANGLTRPTKGFLDSFVQRKERGIIDRIYCTGLIDLGWKADIMAPEYQGNINYISKPSGSSEAIQWGDIELIIPFKGDISVRQTQRMLVR